MCETFFLTMEPKQAVQTAFEANTVLSGYPLSEFSAADFAVLSESS